MELITQQQEDSQQEYTAHCKEMHSFNAFELAFWDWYRFWCEEEGLFYDRQSHQ